MSDVDNSKHDHSNNRTSLASVPVVAVLANLSTEVGTTTVIPRGHQQR